MGLQLHTPPSAFRPSHLMGGPDARGTALKGFDLIGATMHSYLAPVFPPPHCMSLLLPNGYSVNCPYGLGWILNFGPEGPAA